MTTFVDGPAKGKILQLRRAPYFLRVTEVHGNFDALDQLSDEPMRGETLYAYVILGAPGMIHINKRGCGGGFYPIAEYKFVELQPSDTEMRMTDLWSAWCWENKP